MLKNILLIDDDSAVRGMFETGLVARGYRVSVAKDGLDAYQLLQNNDFDVCLMDVMMPRMTGIELLEKASSENLLRKMGKIVAFTSLDKSLIEDKIDKFGLSLCLDKSQLTPEDLHEILSTKL